MSMWTGSLGRTVCGLATIVGALRRLLRLANTGFLAHAYDILFLRRHVFRHRPVRKCFWGAALRIFRGPQGHFTPALGHVVYNAGVVNDNSLAPSL